MHRLGADDGKGMLFKRRQPLSELPPVLTGHLA
jgi:hypothetical protein